MESEQIMVLEESSPRQERRAGQRRAINASVLVIPRDGTEGFWAKARDISRGGMFIRTDRWLPVYAELRTKILPDETHAIHATVRVVRHCEGEGVGCCFVHLPAQSTVHLDRLLGKTGGLPPISGVIEK